MSAAPYRSISAAQGAGQLSVRRKLVVLLAVGLGVLLPALPAAAAPANAWASPSSGNGNTMYNAGEATLTASNAARAARAWTAAGANADGGQRPTVVGDVVYYLHRSINSTDPKTLVAASTRTGATLWQVPLSGPNELFFFDGVTVSGNLALISFQHPRTAGAGLIAVDLTGRRMAWTSSVAANSAQGYAWSSHRVYADASRAYVYLADNTLAAYRLADGRLQWTTRLEDRQNVGLALGAGLLYVGYHPRTPGISAYDTATGRKVWTAPGQGTPVVAGNRVVSSNGVSLIAVNAAGCGAATCPALWQRSFPSGTDLTLGSADASTLFVTYRKPAPPNNYRDKYVGVLARLSTVTGAQQWTTTGGDFFTPAVRGGNVTWVINEYRTQAGVLSYRILGFNATSTSTTAVVSIPVQQRGFPQTLTVGGGALLHKTHIPQQLTAYRVPGT